MIRFVKLLLLRTDHPPYGDGARSKSGKLSSDARRSYCLKVEFSSYTYSTSKRSISHVCCESLSLSVCACLQVLMAYNLQASLHAVQDSRVALMRFASCGLLAPLHVGLFLESRSAKSLLLLLFKSLINTC